jgi:hypothetical protein
MKRFEKIILLFLLAAGVASLGFAFIGPASNWVTSAGLLFDIAGLVQLNISGLFEKIFTEYDDEKKYLYGPPSAVTREIIDNPDAPIRTSLRNMFYFESRTGFYLIVLGCVLQLAGVWV